MGRIEDLTNPLIPACCVVPAIGPGICRVCRSAADELSDRCSSCRWTMNTVARPTDPIVPISLYVVPNQLWRVLRYYKDGPADTAQENFQWQVAALLARFTRDHKQCIVDAAGADWNTVTLVPSGRDRGGPHPLEQAIQRIPWLRGDYARLLGRTAAVVPPHRADSGKYEVTEDVAGRRVLLIDDTFTSGASVQSAATVLRGGQARVLATLVVGRVIRPEYSVAALALWNASVKKKFRFEDCCLRDHSV